MLSAIAICYIYLVSTAPLVMTDARESLLRKVLTDIANRQNYEEHKFIIKALPPTGANFTSQLFFVTISGAKKQELKLFAKVAVIGEALRTQIPVAVYEIERYFYTKLAKVYEQLQERNQVPKEHRLVIPKLYGCNETYLEEVVVLQDLTAEGFTTYDRLKSVHWDYASNAVEQLAKLHALSIAYQEEYPEDYKEATKILKREVPAPDSAAGGAIQDIIGKLIGSVSEENREKVQHFFMENFSMEKLARYFQPLKRPVLIHGDFRISNLMYKENKNGKQVVIVDYQTMSAGSGLNDLMYFIFTGTDAEFRSQYYDQLIDHYYHQLCQALVRLNLDPEIVFSKQDFETEVKEMQMYGLITSALTLPMTMVEMDQVQEDCAESVKRMRVMLQKTNVLCAERFNQIVDDYVRWGLL